MIRRYRDSLGNNHLRLSLGDFPNIPLGDERFVFATCGTLLGLCAGGAVVIAVKRKKMNSLRNSLRIARNTIESTRDIARRDVEQARLFGTSGVFSDLLLTCDNLDRAVAALDPKSTSKADTLTSDKQLREGIEITRKQLYKMMQGHGVNPIDVHIGDTFKPDVCEAVMMQPIPATEDSNSKSGTVSSVILPGYTLHGRVIRPVRVAVYSNETN